MLDPQVVSVTLQFGFAGILLIFVYLVNRQFIVLVGALDRHLERLTSMLDRCIQARQDSEL